MPKKCPRRGLTYCALALSAGIFLGIRLEMPLIFGLAALAALLGLLITRKWLFAPALFFFSGIVLCSCAAHPALPPEGKYTVTARVQGEASIRETDGRVALYLQDAKLRDEAGGEYALKGLYWTYWPEEAETPPFDGQTVCFSGKLYHPQGQRNPHGFDFRLYLLQKGVQAGITGNENLLRMPEDQTAHGDVFLRLRNGLSRRFDALLGEASPLAKALLIGVTEDMPDDVREGFRRAGIAHILSISGLHAMIVMGVAIKLLEKLRASAKAMFVTVMVLLVAYVMLVGADAPIIRAALLTGYIVYARIVRRRRDMLTACALGAILILLVSPLDLFDAGFQMSFGAVLGITLLGDALRTRLFSIRRKWLRNLLSTYIVTLCATLGAALPVICAYNSFSVIGLVINPLACLLSETFMLLSAGTLLLSCISFPAAAVMGKWLESVAVTLTQGVGAAGNMSWASVPVSTPPWYLAVAVILCLLLCTRYIRMSGKGRILTGGAALLASACVLLCSRVDEVRYIQFDVGDADAAVILDGDETIVIDTGEYGSDPGSFLLAEGREVDHLILTHLHTDHALGLEKLLADRIPIRRIYLSTEALKTQTTDEVLALLDEARARGIEICTLSRGDRIATDRVSIEVLWPMVGLGNELRNPNDCALAMVISINQTDILHMSDVPGVLEMYSAVPAEILKTAHHGSDDSTREAFIQAVKPRIALVSSNDLNENTHSRLANAGTMVYDTGKHGALTVTVLEDGYTLQGYIP